jgi:hypothetical protein
MFPSLSLRWIERAFRVNRITFQFDTGLHPWKNCNSYPVRWPKFPQPLSKGRRRRMVRFLAHLKGQSQPILGDCTQFIQVCEIILAIYHDWPTGGAGGWRGRTWFERVQSRIEPSSFTRYLEPHDPEISERLQKSSCVNKGQWLLQDEGDQLLGLSTSGLCLMSEKEWRRIVNQDLNVERAGKDLNEEDWHLISSFFVA